MHPFFEDLLADGVVLTDGAWGTQLQAKGLASGAPPDEWNLSRPDLVREVAASYVKAGSRVILTNSFGANRISLSRHGLAERAGEINRAAVALSREAANGSARVFAAMGPSGKLLMTGEVTEQELYDAFTEQAQALAEARADALVVETMTYLEEARIAVESAHATGLPVVACMVFDSGKDKDRTIMGLAPEPAAVALLAAGADIMGANCGQGIEGMVPICRRLRAAGGRPVWIKANAGIPRLEGGRIRYEGTPESFARHAVALQEAGAGFVGGCCGTDPDHIRAVGKAMRP